MRKRLVILTMVALVTLVAATPALARGGGHGGNGGGGGGRPLFALVGTIAAIGENTITVDVVDGNRFVVPYIGGELTVQLTNSTGFFEWTPDGREPIAFEDVTVGDTTSIHGTVADNVFTADRVTVDVPCVP